MGTRPRPRCFQPWQSGTWAAGRSWDAPVGERLRLGGQRFTPTWIRRGTMPKYLRRQQYGLQCAECLLWVWACTVNIHATKSMIASSDRWWCHVREDGRVEEGNDCPSCGYCSRATEMAAYKRLGD